MKNFDINEKRNYHSGKILKKQQYEMFCLIKFPIDDKIIFEVTIRFILAA